jgi:hypothetical protein
MAQITWKQLNDAALTTNGLLADLLAQPDDPNAVLARYGLGTLSAADITRWKDVLSSTAGSPTRLEILRYIARLLPGQQTKAIRADDPPPMW